MIYNWQLKDWPHFVYDLSGFEDKLAEFIQRTGRLGGLAEGLTSGDQEDAIVEMMITEALKTSEIEGEYLNRRDVMSSIRKNLGLSTAHQSMDKKSNGAALLMTTVRKGFKKPLTQKMLFEWHKLIMMGSRGIKTGSWRKGIEPIQVVSGSIGREKVHFEAPPSQQVSDEMRQFITWFNQSKSDNAAIKHAPVRSAIAHLYFESIHPFEDGNGRIGRAISEKAISQGLGQPVLMSLSEAIEGNKNKYYEALKKAQKSNEITEWLSYFIDTILDAQTRAEKLIKFTIHKARFFETFKPVLNNRQIKVIKRMLAEGPGGFEGGMSAQKYTAIAKTTKATATRDLQDLVKKGAFEVSGGGRSTRYELKV